jgi:hypothetical protein
MYKKLKRGEASCWRASYRLNFFLEKSVELSLDGIGSRRKLVHDREGWVPIHMVLPLWTAHYRMR